MAFDYSFFEKSLSTVRRMQTHVNNPWHIMDGARAIGTPEQLLRAPKVISDAGDDIHVVFDTTSYATIPGTNLNGLREFLCNQPPEDFLEFYKRYAEALVVTRSYPIHLWNEEKILKEAAESCELWNRQKPIRFFRFGEYYEYDAQMFGLWQEKAGGKEWKVIVTDHYSRDLEYDVDGVEPVYILADSFYDWLQFLVVQEGIPDPFFEVGPEGGYIDPV